MHEHLQDDAVNYGGGRKLDLSRVTDTLDTVNNPDNPDTRKNWDNWDNLLSYH